MKKLAALVTLAVMAGAFAGCSGGVSGGVLPVASQTQQARPFESIGGGPITAPGGKESIGGGPITAPGGKESIGGGPITSPHPDGK